MKLKFELYSWFDKNSRLLQVPDDKDYVYRAISEQSYEIWHDLSRKGNLESLYQIGLVKTDLAAFQVEGYTAVLRHKKIPFVSEPNEWTMQMLSEAGQVICRLAIEFDKLGYGLQDSHPWNVAFDGATPIFFDWGSIIKKEDVSQTAWLLEFRKQIFLPLWLFSKGLRTFAYESLWERRGGSAKYLFNHPYLRKIPFPFGRLLQRVGKVPFSAIISQLLEMIIRLKISEAPGLWSEYDQSSYTYKDDAVKEFLNLLPDSSDILDMGANRGAYSIQFSQAGHRVVAFDYDSRAVNHLFVEAKNKSYNILPLRIDVMRPTPAYGPDLSSPDMFTRLRCDYAVAFAISHHLAKNYGLRFDAFASIMEKYARHGVLVEYIDPSDMHLQNWQKKGWQPPDWYSESSFIAAFSHYFNLEKTWQTLPEEKIVRNLFYFTRKSK